MVNKSQKTQNLKKELSLGKSWTVNLQDNSGGKDYNRSLLYHNKFEPEGGIAYTLAKIKEYEPSFTFRKIENVIKCSFQ